jgi:diacylglycerol O-acyltransferase / wax synthase
MMVPLPLGEPDPVRRLALIAAETAARSHKARPEAGSGIFRFVAGQRAWYWHFPRQRSVNLVVTNVPGPPAPLYLAGARLLELFPVVPVMGNLTFVVSVLSYAGQLNLTAVADRELCPDLEVFVQGVRRSLDALAASVLAATPVTKGNPTCSAAINGTCSGPGIGSMPFRHNGCRPGSGWWSTPNEAKGCRS